MGLDSDSAWLAARRNLYKLELYAAAVLYDVNFRSFVKLTGRHLIGTVHQSVGGRATKIVQALAS
jgi:hypothetical protein